MSRRLKKTYTLKHRQVTRNTEGGDVESWEDPIEIRATIWQASGRMLAEMYGERLAYMRNMEYEGTATIRENDGVCVFVASDHSPDYRVVSINEDYKPKVFLLEAIR